MKKISVIVSVILCSVLLACFFAACGAPSAHKVTFDLNYDGAPAATVIEVEDNTFVTAPSAPERKNYEFLGWFSDKECTQAADLERSVTADMTVYAGWKLTSVSVTFDLNYEGGGTYGEVQSVSVGGTPVRPDNPTRNGFTFIDWYTVSDAAKQTEDTRYKFTPVSENSVFYAGWEELGEDTASVSLLWNYDGAPNNGVYSAQQVNIGSKLPVPSLTREADGDVSYIHTGWKDESGNEYEAGSEITVSGNITLSAVWTVKNTYEAEFTDMSMFQGAGWSWNRVGTGAIEYDRDNKLGTNAGYEAYVANMNQKRAFLYFEIKSDKAVSGLTLKLRLSLESYFPEMTLTPEIFAISTATSFNGERSYIDYEDIRLVGEVGVSVVEFKDCLVTAELSLAEGMNYIFVETAATFAEAGYPELAGNMGAMSAIAPVVDAMIIEYAEGSADLSWTPRVCNLWNYGYDAEEYPCSCDKHDNEA